MTTTSTPAVPPATDTLTFDPSLLLTIVLTSLDRYGVRAVVVDESNAVEAHEACETLLRALRVEPVRPLTRC
jgi:hypothetical protein